MTIRLKIGYTAFVMAEGGEELLRTLFTPEGCNLGAIRLNIGASDYSTGLYSYNDTPGDTEMKNFTLSRDDEFLVPMAKAVKTLRPDTYVFAAPWSPPGWTFGDRPRKWLI